MRILTLALAMFLASATCAEEPKLPANMTPPMTAFARAEADGSAVIVTLKLVNSVPQTGMRTVTDYVTVQKNVGGKVVAEKVPVTKTVTYTIMKPLGWREVKVDAADKGISFTDAAGKPIAPEKLVKMLSKDTPVLVSTTGPVDPFHLLTVKKDTIVIVAPPQVLSTPQAGQPGAPVKPAKP